MAKLMTQLDILAKNVMGNGIRSVNFVGVSGVNLEEVKFKVLFNEEVNFLANQEEGYCANYPRPCGNQGWKRDEGRRDRDREWCDHNATWKERETEQDRYVPPHERQKSKDSEVGLIEDMLSYILNKVEGFDNLKRNEGKYFDSQSNGDLSLFLYQEVGNSNGSNFISFKPKTTSGFAQ